MAPSVETIEQRILREFGDPEMVDIARCESGLKQFNASGNVIRSHTNDYGLFQINYATWNDDAHSMGIDYMTLDGNIEMAKHVLKVQGKSAWVCYNIFIKNPPTVSP